MKLGGNPDSSTFRVPWTVMRLVLHRGDREISARESFALYGGYMAIAMAFGAWVWWARGSQSGLEFLTGYLIEQSLAMDNIFVIATVFTFLGIPRMYQHRVLFWGILGVIVLAGAALGRGGRDRGARDLDRHEHRGEDRRKGRPGRPGRPSDVAPSGPGRRTRDGRASGGGPRLRRRSPAHCQRTPPAPRSS